MPASSATGGASCNVPNTAALAMTTGTQKSNRASASATGRIFGPACFEWTGSSQCSPGYVWNGKTCVSLTGPGAPTTHFVRSPLVLNKWGDSSCVQRGANWECNYVVNVQNFGQQGYQGDIDFDENLDVAPISTNFTIDPSPFVSWWTCVGAGASYHCHFVAKPGQKLEYGQSVTLHIKVLVPDDGRCSPVFNLAALTPSTGEAAGSTAIKNTGICTPGKRAQSNAPPESGQSKTVPTGPPLDRRCPDPDYRIGGPDGPCCRWTPHRNPACHCVNQIRSKPDGNCCPSGQQWNGHDCVTPCEDAQRRKSDLTCCPLNTHAAGDFCLLDVLREHYCPPERMMPRGKCCPEHTKWNGEQCFLPTTPKGQQSSTGVPQNLCEAGYIAFPSRGRVPKGWDIRPISGDDTRVCAKGAITSAQPLIDRAAARVRQTSRPQPGADEDK